MTPEEEIAEKLRMKLLKAIAKDQKRKTRERARALRLAEEKKEFRRQERCDFASYFVALRE